MAQAASYDYRRLNQLFSRLIKEQLGLTLIELNSNGKPPVAPYVAFDIISPYIPLNFLEDDKAFEAVVSFTVYARSKLEALGLADQCRQLLGSQMAIDACVAADTVIVERMPTQIRYVPETTMIAYMVGFDVRLRLSEPYTDNVDPITQIDL